MTRIYVVVEGQTEESFINAVLAPALWRHDKYAKPIILGRSVHKGGNTNYARVKSHVVLLLKQDQTAYCTTMLDLYGLGKDFPGMPLPPDLPNVDKVTRIEQGMKADIAQILPNLRPDTRFLPYIQLHEYEGLLFSDPMAFASKLSQPHLSKQFQRIRDEFPSPEDINDGPNTAPSKRVLDAHPAYRKVVDGTLAAQAVGIARMRQECPHFNDWLQKLEVL